LADRLLRNIVTVAFTGFDAACGFLTLVGIGRGEGQPVDAKQKSFKRVNKARSGNRNFIEMSMWLAVPSKTGKLPARNITQLSPRHAPWLCGAPGLQLFFAYELQDPVLEQRLRQHLLKFGILPLKLLEPLGLVDLHLPKLLLPPVECHFRDVLLSAYFRDRIAAIRLPKDPDLILCRVFLAFHVWFVFTPD